MNEVNSLSKLEVVVVGAGPAGLIAGILLRERGHRVVIIEASPAARRPVCGEYLTPEGVECLIRLGLGFSIEGFEKILGMVLVSPSNRRVRASFPENRYGISLNREIFQTRLLEKFLSDGGFVEVGTRLQKISRSVNRPHLELSSGKSLSCDLLIGADGRRSSVAQLSGMGGENPKNGKVAIHAYLKPLHPMARYGQMLVARDGSYIGINPIHDEEINFSLVIDASRLQGKENLHRLVNERITAQESLTEVLPPVGMDSIQVTYPICRVASKVVSPNIALIGDASGFIDPLTGEGITTAIKTASSLVESLDRHVNLNLALTAYATARISDYQQKETLNRVLQKVIRQAWLCELIAVGLRASERLRAVFIGVIGNVYTPSQAIRKLFSIESRKEFARGQNHRS